MYFDDTIRLSPEVPGTVLKRIQKAKEAFVKDDFLAFEAEWDAIECLIKSLLSSDAIQPKDFNRIYEMFGHDWWNVDPNDPDVIVRPYGPGTPCAAPIWEIAAKRYEERLSGKKNPGEVSSPGKSA